MSLTSDCSAAQLLLMYETLLTRLPSARRRKDEFAKADLKPRSQKTKEWQQKKKKEQEADGYRDRAKERRTGKEGDFSAAEKLLEVSELRWRERGRLAKGAARG